ncbi:class I SAM-dependent methyltransferase [Zavarzinia sp. CC-PAN008]|uniref:class I SAM-dependent methyltransferase n=1 Tax=Zavarzinia sp. CC-PAN008 TaxID=3243332 RepID=UPI003F746BB7
MANAADRIGYRMAQAARVAWYGGQYLAAARLTRPHRAAVSVDAPMPGSAVLLRHMRALLDRDRRNVEDGTYAAPRLLPPADRALADMVRFFRDLPGITRRQATHGHDEVLDGDGEGRRGRYPRYYLQNFHYQTDGYLSERSARLYDQQVEVLFTGLADAMRRQALVPLRQALQPLDLRRARVADIACGTGRFLGDLKATWPRVQAMGVDLSRDYLAEARRHLAGRAWLSLVEAQAEHLPLADGALDAVTCIYLFHELPPRVRGQVAAELARVVRPGGSVIVVDSLQIGDVPDLDGLLHFFPAAFHEPYFATYARADLGALFGGAGLDLAGVETAFLSKVLHFRRPL